MSRTRRRPAQARVHIARTCGAALLVVAAACSDPTAGPHQVSAGRGGAAGTFLVAPEGRIEAVGTAESPLSLGRAVAMAPAGSTIRLKAGTYETSGLTIDRQMTIEAEPGATVEFKGNATIAADQWEPAGRAWRTPWTAATLAETTEPASSSVSAASVSVGQRSVARQQRLSVEGKALVAASAITTLSPGSFYVDTAEKWLYVAQDPTLHAVKTGGADIGVLVTGPNVKLIGVSVHEFASIGLRIQGSYGTVSYGDFSYNGLIGLDINGASHFTAQHSSMTHNGQVGIEASHSSNVTIQYNNISNNNTGNYNVSWAAAGLKGTDITNVVVKGNFVADNASNAIWFDSNSLNVTIVGNQVTRNKCFGIYFELNNGPLIVGNYVYNNVQAGIGVHFTTNARVYNNTMVNNGTDLDVSASYNRSPYDTYNAVIVNNIFWNAGSLMSNLYRYNGCSSWVYKEVDYNAYYRPSGSRSRYVVNWCNRWYATIGAFHSGTGNEAHGIEYDGGGDPFFVSETSGNFNLHSGSPAIRRGQGVPDDVAAALNVRPWTAINMGAAQ
jgi:mannuronan 5-epimerase